MLLEFKFEYLTEFKLMKGNIDSNILLNISFFMILVAFFLHIYNAMVHC